MKFEIELKEVFNEDAESAVLGILLNNFDTVGNVVSSLTAADFYFPKYRLIFGTIVDLFRAGKEPDSLLVSEHLGSKKLLGDVGGKEVVEKIKLFGGDAKQLKHFTDIIKDKSIRRQIISANVQNFESVLDESVDVSSVLANVQSRIVRISSSKEEDDSAKASVRALQEAQEEYADKYAKGQQLIGYSCGFEKIDNIVDGLRPGHIWVVGAWTSTGKTFFSLFVMNALLNQHVPFSLVSLEMSKADLMARIIGLRLNISANKVLKGKFELDFWKRVEKEKSFLYDSSFSVHTSYFDLEKIKMVIRKDAHLLGVKVFFVDYVQNIMSEHGLREYELLTKAANDFQALARDLGVTIYLVSQVSNESEKGVAAGAGFKGTGALEAVADLAIRLKRDKKNEKPEDVCVPMKIHVLKNRMGYTGIIEDYFMYLKSGLFHVNPTLPEWYDSNAR